MPGTVLVARACLIPAQKRLGRGAGGDELEQQVNQRLHADFQGSPLEEHLIRMESSMEEGTHPRNKYQQQRGVSGRRLQ